MFSSSLRETPGRIERLCESQLMNSGLVLYTYYIIVAVVGLEVHVCFLLLCTSYSELRYSMVHILIFIWPVCSELSVGRQLYHYARKTILSLGGVYLQQGHCEGHRVQGHWTIQWSHRYTGSILWAE